MSFALLYPLGLAALAALLLPLLLHVIRRAEYRTTPFAAMRWIRAQLRQHKRLRLRDIPLLLLRLLLLALAALLLAQPVLRGDATAAKHWVLVAPGVDVGAARDQLQSIDSNSRNADWRWLAPGFPSVSSTAAPATSDSASLLREIDAEVPESSQISVVVPAVVDGLDGERPSLSRDVEWIVVDGAMPARPIDHDGTTTRLLVRYDNSQPANAGYINALEKVWRLAWPSVSIERGEIDAAFPANARWLLWLSPQRPESLQRWINSGGIAVATPADSDDKLIDREPIWIDDQQNVIASSQRIGKGRLIRLSGAFTPNELPALLDPDFPQRLHDLFAGPPNPPTRALAEALKPLHATNAAATVTASSATRTPLDVWFALVIAILFAVERIWTSGRRGVKS
ncbi:MAG: BatA domain-containing protein [Dokdonella sp.]